MKFKIGQVVYYYDSDKCDILSGTVTKAIKDLQTRKVIYSISYNAALLQIFDLDYLRGKTFETDGYGLYKSKKLVYKLFKDEIHYAKLIQRCNELETLLNKIMLEYADKIQATPGFATISFADCGTKSIVVDGIGNLQEEFNKLKFEVEKLKKKTKRTKKKQVLKKPSSENK